MRKIIIYSLCAMNVLTIDSALVEYAATACQVDLKTLKTTNNHDIRSVYSDTEWKCFDNCAHLERAVFLKELQCPPALFINCPSLSYVNVKQLQELESTMIRDCPNLNILLAPSVKDMKVKGNGYESAKPFEIAPLFLDIRSYSKENVPAMQIPDNAVIIANGENAHIWRQLYPTACVLCVIQEAYFTQNMINITNHAQDLLEDLYNCANRQDCLKRLKTFAQDLAEGKLKTADTADSAEQEEMHTMPQTDAREPDTLGHQVETSGDTIPQTDAREPKVNKALPLADNKDNPLASGPAQAHWERDIKDWIDLQPESNENATQAQYRNDHTALFGRLATVQDKTTDDDGFVLV